MILNLNESTVQTVGDVQENKVSIDTNNIEHIISILSSNLYSNPQESFLRETISNAIDSHIEAGSDKPVILSFESCDNGKSMVIVRDYGTGISPERFEKIYLNIGSSTKRESNDYIGNFGIGRFSALAVSDIVHITSFYDGICYKYLMVKNGNNININKVAQLQTNESNGVEIKVYVDDIFAFKDTINSLWYFDKLYINCNFADDTYNRRGFKDKVSQFNSRIIDKYKTFYTSNNRGSRYDLESSIILGNVLYPISRHKFPSATISLCNSDLLRYCNLKFEIGELDVTPNREQLLYSDKTVKCITNKLNEFFNELREIAQINRNTDNIFKYYKNLTSYDLDINEYLSVDAGNIINDKTNLYKSKELTDIQNGALKSFFNLNVKLLPGYKFIINHGDVVDNNKLKSVSLSDLLDNEGCFMPRRNRYSTYAKIHLKLLILSKNTKDRAKKLKRYLAETYYQDTVLVIKEQTLKSFVSSLYSPSCLKWLLLQMLKQLKKTNDIIYFDDATNEDYQNYIQQQTEAKPSTNTKFESKITVYLTESTWGSYQYRLLCSSFKDVETHFKLYQGSIKKIVCGVRDDPRWHLLRLWYSEKFNLVRYAATNSRKFKDIPSNWIRLEDIINYKNPHVRDVITYHQYRARYDNTDIRIVGALSECTNTLDAEVLRTALTKRYYEPDTESQVALFNEFLKDFVNNKYSLNYDIIQQQKTLQNYVNIAKRLKNLWEITNSSYLLSYWAMKNKLLRMNFTSYQFIKNHLNLNLNNA